jgi:hypothetical protein
MIYVGYLARMGKLEGKRQIRRSRRMPEDNTKMNFTAK